MSRPMWRVYEVRSKNWCSPPNTISTCSTLLRSPSRRLSTRLLTSRAPSWASAQCSVAPSPIDGVPVLEGDGRLGQLLEARDRQLRLATERDLQRSGHQRLRRSSRDRARRHQLLHDRRLGAVAERDPRPADEGTTGLAGRPANHDRVGEADAGRNVEADALVPEAARERGQLLVVGEAASAFELGSESVRVPREGRAECLKHDAAGRDLGARARPPTLSSWSSINPPTPAGSSNGTPGAGTFAVRMYGRTSASSAARRSR